MGYSVGALVVRGGLVDAGLQAWLAIFTGVLAGGLTGLAMG